MRIMLKEGDEPVTIEFLDKPGEIHVGYGKKAISVFATSSDSKGRSGEIYRKDFLKFSIGDEVTFHDGLEPQRGSVLSCSHRSNGNRYLVKYGKDQEFDAYEDELTLYQKEESDGEPSGNA